MMRKLGKLAVFAVAVSFALPAIAADPDIAALQKYATKSLPLCEGNTVIVQPMQSMGPAGFLPYRVIHQSDDTECGGQAILLYSPASGQILIGPVFGLPLDNRPPEVRITEAATQMMHEPVTATIDPIPLPDGLRAVSITKQTKWGPFSYRAYLDGSKQYMMVGERGSLFVNPHTTLVESLGMENAVRRGNPKARMKIIELSDFECPTCGIAHKVVEPLIEKHLIKVDYYRLDLPLFDNHEWALPAALGARAIERVAPKQYWVYVNFVFANQDAISKTPSFTTVLKNFCDDHSIDWKKVEPVYSSPEEKASLLDQVSRAYAIGITQTPTYIINGQIMGYGPKGKFTFDAIRKAIGLK